MLTSKKSYNPILFENKRTQRLEKAKALFFSALDNYLHDNPDMQLEVEQIKKETELAYIQLKSQYLIESKCSHFNSHLLTALNFAINKNKESEKVPHSHLYYLKESNRFTFNEQH